MNLTDPIPYIPFILAFIAVVLFTPFVRRTLLSAGITDNPIVSEHSHKQGTPTMGGLAILLGSLLVLCLYSGNKILVITTAVMLVASIIGLFDDLLGLKVKEFQKVTRNITSQTVELGRLMLKPGEEARIATPKAKKDVDALVEEGKIEIIREVPIKSEMKEGEKIFSQILVSLFLVVSGSVPFILNGYYVGLLSIPIAIIGVVGAINAVNLIDGMDGLASGVMGIASLATAIFCILTGRIEVAVAFMALSGVCFGFLVFNKIPASIFMGDTGSFALGGFYAAAAILGDVIIFAVVAITVPIISVIISLMHRSKIIKLPVEPLHHTLNYKGLSEGKIVALYWITTIIICMVALYFYQAF
ncbi:MAG TPA: glycosyltransferase family 4 protein [Methanobacterium sp.]|nr:glycosyltransferase family 4 protein [Methanobacterium sp.]